MSSVRDELDKLAVMQAAEAAWGNRAAALGEVRITDPKTGGQKGSKLAQLGAVDPLALMTVAEVAGFGAAKYARYNFAKGYRWSLSYDAMQRHLHAFWNGEERDDESSLSHLAHAAWHCLTLLCFQLRKRGTDDRMHHMVVPEGGVDDGNGAQAIQGTPVNLNAPRMVLGLPTSTSRAVQHG